MKVKVFALVLVILFSMIAAATVSAQEIGIQPVEIDPAVLEQLGKERAEWIKNNLNIDNTNMEDTLNTYNQTVNLVYNAMQQYYSNMQGILGGMK